MAAMLPAVRGSGMGSPCAAMHAALSVAWGCTAVQPVTESVRAGTRRLENATKGQRKHLRKHPKMP